MKTRLALAALFVFAAYARAEDVPLCSDTLDPTMMSQCAGPDFEKANKDLAAVLLALTAQAVADDTAEGKGSHDTEQALLSSQQAWLNFREAECKWQGFAAHGDSMEPQLVQICAAKLTRDRIKQLQTGVSE